MLNYRALCLCIGDALLTRLQNHYLQHHSCTDICCISRACLRVSWFSSCCNGSLQAAIAMPVVLYKHVIGVSSHPCVSKIRNTCKVFYSQNQKKVTCILISRPPVMKQINVHPQLQTNCCNATDVIPRIYLLLKASSQLYYHSGLYCCPEKKKRKKSC